MKTYTAKPKEVEKKWYLIDAKDQILGRLATKVADTLRGKNKIIFTPSIDCGDYVIVINTAEIKLSGEKFATKKYYSHSGYPGGIKETSISDMMAKNPNLVVEKAVRGMLPKNRLAESIIKKMKLYPGPEHGQIAQKPEKLEIS